MIEINIPRLGWSMEEGVFSAWLKREGDWVEKDDPLFVLESDKASQEIESFEAGLLRIGPNGPQPGETVKVGQVIGYLTARDEVSEFASASADRTREAAGNGGLTAHVVAMENDADRETVVHSAAGEPFASPRARRTARERGVDWRTISGSGRGGRVRERDVLSAAALPGVSLPEKPTVGRPSSPSFETDSLEGRPTDAPLPSGHGSRGVSESKLTAPPLLSARRTIAERMLAGARATAPVTLTTKIDAANLVNLRSQFKAASPQDAPTITDVVVKLAAKALEEHPVLNARWQENQIVLNRQINVGFAVDTAAGLVAPVIHDVPGLGLKHLAAVSRSLVERARNNRLRPEEMQGGTFTVTNLGMYGIDAFTPIINPPETAILGLGAVRREAVVLDDDRLVAGHVLTLSLTFDHRVIDGAPAARFLQFLGQLIKNPATSLVA